MRLFDNELTAKHLSFQILKSQKLLMVSNAYVYIFAIVSVVSCAHEQDILNLYKRKYNGDVSYLSCATLKMHSITTAFIFYRDRLLIK